MIFIIEMCKRVIILMFFWWGLLVKVEVNWGIIGMVYVFLYYNFKGRRELEREGE